MCGGCYRCGEYRVGMIEHPRGCALPRSARKAIRMLALDVRVGEAAIAAAEDEALRIYGVEGLREQRREDDAREREREEREHAVLALSNLQRTAGHAVPIPVVVPAGPMIPASIPTNAPLPWGQAIYITPAPGDGTAG